MLGKKNLLNEDKIHKLEIPYQYRETLNFQNHKLENDLKFSSQTNFSMTLGNIINQTQTITVAQN